MGFGRALRHFAVSILAVLGAAAVATAPAGALALVASAAAIARRLGKLDQLPATIRSSWS